jgi:para-nitrobenzyl esterase
MVLGKPTVRTTSGRVRGVVRDGVPTFLGIPYAAPPFGRRRFAEPQAPRHRLRVRHAARYGPTAPKPPFAPPFDVLFREPTIPGRNCLNLNVWTPDPGAAGLPVFVWIHGGGFIFNSNAVPTYDGAAFARDGVVCVTINYRLGVDGFLQFADGGPANRGLLDQIAALRWVQDNIAAFGGDPARVTIGGESAGGMSVACLLAMPKTERLFGRAVLQSGAGHHALHPPTASKIADYLAQRLNLSPTRQALGGVPLPDLIAAQQAIVGDAQMAPNPAHWGEVALNLLAFEPVIDGAVLPALPIERIAAGSACDVPVLIGTNRDEWRIFLVPNGLIDTIDNATLKAAAKGYGLDPDTAIPVYRAARPGASPGELLADIATDWFFRIPAIRLAEAQVNHHQRAWMYEFSWPSPQFDGRLGACHALELGFTFDTLTTEAHGALHGSEPEQLAHRMHHAWVRFIRDGDPGWTPYDTSRRPVQEFGRQITVVDDPRREARELWHDIRR